MALSGAESPQIPVPSSPHSLQPAQTFFYYPHLLIFTFWQFQTFRKTKSNSSVPKVKRTTASLRKHLEETVISPFPLAPTSTSRDLSWENRLFILSYRRWFKLRYKPSYSCFSFYLDTHIIFTISQEVISLAMRAWTQRMKYFPKVTWFVIRELRFGPGI